MLEYGVIFAMLIGIMIMITVFLTIFKEHGNRVLELIASEFP